MVSVTDYLAFSHAAYQGPNGNYSSEPLPKDWRYVATSPPNDDGYFGVAFANDKTKEVVIANRGSRPSLDGLGPDWVTSDGAIVKQSTSDVPASFSSATDFASNVQNDPALAGYTASYTGHSLGGGEAQVQAAVLGGRATTFDAPGVKFAVSQDQAADAASRVTNYVWHGDLVGHFGDHIGGLVEVGDPSADIGNMAKSVGLSLLVGNVLGPIGALAGLLFYVAGEHSLDNFDSWFADNPPDGATGPSAGPMSGMGMPAARITDMHLCPLFDGLVPHVGGPVVMGSPDVITSGMPQARVGDMLVCMGPPDVVAVGSPTVLVNGLPAARLGDMTVHGGVIIMGVPTTWIG